MARWTRRTALAAMLGQSLLMAAGHARAQERALGEEASATLSSLLSRYVSPHADGVNRVDYARWRANAADLARLDQVIARFSAARPARMARDEAFAYWANLYSALTLKVVLERYPVRSIREIRSTGVPFDPQAYIGPWRTKRVTVEGRRLSLDDIEHGTLRPLVRDPRVHYAVNCASIGCPNLQPAAWRAETLGEDLDRAAAQFINHPRAVTVLTDGSLRVSSIYVWFKEDFAGDDSGVIAHLRRYAGPALAQRLAAATRISGHAYDWAINAA